MTMIKLQQSKTGSAELKLSQVMADLNDGKFRNVVFMVGAGISTAAGIPDFRTPGTGLYSNLAKLKLPFPEAVFELDYLRKRPEAFFTLAKELYPDQYEPTDFHYFMKWVGDKGYLKRVYTQNIDTLERLTGLDGDYVVEAHGSFASSHCIDCRHEMPTEKFKEELFSSESKLVIPKCAKCKGIIKPDIVFFGESLPRRFFTLLEEDLETDEADSRPDLVIIAGTSLQVHPFASLPDYLDKNCVRILFNTERVGDIGSRPKDIVVLGHLETINQVIPADAAKAIRAEKARKVASSEISNDGTTEESGQLAPSEDHDETLKKEEEVLAKLRKDIEQLDIDKDTKGQEQDPDLPKCDSSDKGQDSNPKDKPRLQPEGQDSRTKQQQDKL